MVYFVHMWVFARRCVWCFFLQVLDVYTYVHVCMCVCMYVYGCVLCLCVRVSMDMRV